MSRCAASAAPATYVTQKLARHRVILHEFIQEFRRIKGNINSMKGHAELLSSVRDDINEYKASGSPRMQLLRERAAIRGSIAHVILSLDLTEKKVELCTMSGLLLFSYLKFGFNREEGGIVYREWAPVVYFMYRHAARNNVAAMLPFAAQVAAANCRALGARTGLPLRSDPRLASFLHQSSKVRVTSSAT